MRPINTPEPGDEVLTCSICGEHSFLNDGIDYKNTFHCKECAEKKINCYECIHNGVCHYFQRVKDFPFSDDAGLKYYFEKVSELMASNCRYYNKKRAVDK